MFASPEVTGIILVYSLPVQATRERLGALRARIESRLGALVTLVELPDSSHSLDDAIESAQRACRAIIDRSGTTETSIALVPIGTIEIDRSIWNGVVAWLHDKQLSLRLSVAPPFTVDQFTDWIWTSIQDRLGLQPDSHPLTDLILVCDNSTDQASVATGTFHLRQSQNETQVDYAFLTQGVPKFADRMNAILAARKGRIGIVTWGRADEGRSAAVAECLAMSTQQEVVSADGWILSGRRDEPILSLDLLESQELINIVVANYYSPWHHYDVGERITADVTEVPTISEWELAKLDQRVAAMLPDEYRGRLDYVSPRSMGSVQLSEHEFGQVPWDTIWTSFCDLAVAGGPPHRGRLLEAVPSTEIEADRGRYQQVVAEIERGIRLTTGLTTVESPALGWVGVECQDELMAVWLLRAIIVENVMVRREGKVLFLPAAPRFTIQREIKNVITAVAKTVHYWQAHLRYRGPTKR